MDEILKVENVTKRFGGIVALRHVSLTVEEGSITSLIGPNGAGKTTLFNIINGYIKPDEGRIFFRKEDITKLPPHAVCKRGIGRTFQENRVFANMTVLDNVVTGALLRTSDVNEAESRALESLKIVGLQDKKNLIVKNLTILERKMVELARALATRPVLLLLDEIAAGLTEAEIVWLLKLLKRINSKLNITLFVIEHVLKFVMRISDKVIVLDHGVKIAEGSPEEVASNSKVIEAYIGGEEVA
ncbi:MAG: ABC transporter ATP-binding protein [Desulfurococcales archaeon ex4484_217_2]|nr:MAG: ABC transporter ATP-binding protein [Desulfurococcales archaeon ex4484_217_2]